MRWHLEHSGKEYEFKMHAAAQGFDVKLTPKPEGSEFIQFYVDCFFDLCAFRIELQPISLVNIVAYCDLFELEDKQTVTRFVTALDSAYREVMFEKQQREMKKHAARTKGKR